MVSKQMLCNGLVSFLINMKNICIYTNICIYCIYGEHPMNACIVFYINVATLDFGDTMINFPKINFQKIVDRLRICAYGSEVHDGSFRVIT